MFARVTGESRRKHPPSIRGLAIRVSERELISELSLHRIAKGPLVSSALDLSDLGHRVISSGMPVILHRLVRHCHPSADQPPSTAE